MIGPNTPIKGAEDAKVVIVEFSDFQCPACKARSAEVAEVLKKYDGKVKIAYRHFPLPQHNYARDAAVASMAAKEQGKFWEYHDMLFANQPEFQKEKLINYAERLGLDLDKFKRDFDEPKIEEQIESDIALGYKINIQFTPSFFVNGLLIDGSLEEAVAKEVTKKYPDTAAVNSASDDATPKPTNGDQPSKPANPTPPVEPKPSTDTATKPTDTTDEENVLVIRFTAEGGFSPKNTTAYKGDKVRWVNDTDKPIIFKQRMTTYPELREPKTIEAGGSFEFTLYKTKLWTYIEESSQMTGSIFVMDK